MKRLLLYLVLLAGATSCNHQTALPSRDHIPAQFITIDTRRDTTLHMKDGLEIIIPANALSAPGNSAKLEVREALDIQTMIRGGLATKSDAKLLSSGGMFKIAPAGDTKVSIHKAITVKVPADNISSSMQLYDGIEKDGVINWENPRPLNDTIENENNLGKVLYENNCQKCHDDSPKDNGLSKITIGGGILHEWDNDTATLFAYVRDATNALKEGKMRRSCSYLSEDIGNAHNFPAITNDELTAIFKYVNKTFGVRPVSSQCDSCLFYLWHLLQVKDLVGMHHSTPPQDFVTRTDTRTADTIPGSGKITEAGTHNGHQIKASYYTVKIDNFGWKNVDEETRNLLTAVPCKLSVTVNGPKLPSMHIYLVMPQDKILSPGGLLSDGTSYGFYGTDSLVYLPQKATAYVFAIAEDPDKKEFYFAQTNFTTSYINQLSLQLQPTAPENFENFIAQVGADKGLSAKVGTVSAADGLMPADSNLARLIKHYEAMVSRHCNNK